MKPLPILTGLLVCTIASGCGTTRPWDAVAGRFSKSDTEQDALLLEKESLSDGFQKSQGKFASKGLKNPEATNLAFARWKEDLGQYAEAKRRYHEVLTANPKCLSARLGIARIERETGRFTQCREILMAALEQHPKDTAIMMELGRMYNEREQWDRSVQAFSQAADIAPDDQSIRYELGLALANGNRIDEALQHLKFAVGDSAAAYNIGYILNEQGRSAEAVQWVNRALDSHPDERTRKMASEMLAEMRFSDSPASPEQSRSVASRQRNYTGAPQIQPGPTAGAVRPVASTEWNANRGASASQTVNPAQQRYSPIPAHRPAATSGVATYNGSSSAPPQWSGPEQSPPQWTRSTRQQVPVHTTGYSQPASPTQVTDPPAWRQ